MRTWGSAKVWAVPPSIDVFVPPSTDVCVSVRATSPGTVSLQPHQPPARLAAQFCQGGVGDKTSALPWLVCAATLGAVTGA